MKAYEIPKGATKLEDLRRAERPEPKPGPSDVLVRIRAAALNYRDHAIITRKYRYDTDRDTIPCSDGAGDVVAVGANVTRFKPGDRVIPTFFQVWIDAPRTNFIRRWGFPSTACCPNTWRSMRTASWRSRQDCRSRRRPLCLAPESRPGAR